MLLTLSLHGANRILERSVPFEALEGVRIVRGLLNDKPLKFRFKGVTIVAKMVNDSPKIITAWRETR